MTNKRCLFLGIISLFFWFNCSELHFSALNCSGEDCPHNGDISLLQKQPMDMLIVMENSEQLEQFNSVIAVGLKQFLKCIEPVHWRLGVVSAVDGGESQLGQLMNMESEGQLSSRDFVDSYVYSSEDLVLDTVSLSSGCSLPPYCETGAVQPLRAIKTFMGNPDSQRFLRPHTPLSTIVVTASGGDDEEDSSVEDVLASTQSGYYTDHFINFTVTVPEEGENCQEIAEDREFSHKLAKGTQSFIQLGGAIGLMMANPIILLGSAIVGSITGQFISDHHTDIKSRSISQLALLTHGRVFNLCNPLFGKALAYSILEKLHIQEQASPGCRHFIDKIRHDLEHHHRDEEREHHSPNDVELI